MSSPIAATPQVAPATSPPRRRARLSARGAVLLVLVMLLLVAAVGPVRSLLAERSSLAQLQRQAIELQARNDQLQGQVDRLNDPAYVERLARECLGMVHAGEIAFRAIPKQGAPVPPHC